MTTGQCQSHLLIKLTSISRWLLPMIWLIGVGFIGYSEWIAHLPLCSYCLISRLIWLLLGLHLLLRYYLIFKKAHFHSGRAWGINTLFGLLLWVLGLLLSAHHFAMQIINQDAPPSCQQQVLHWLPTNWSHWWLMHVPLHDCSTIVWTWLGLSVPGWSVLAYGVGLIGSILLACANGCCGKKP